MQNDVAVDNVWTCNGVPFRAGDRVKIVRMEETFAPNGMGEGKRWENSWQEDYSNGHLTINAMSAYIGVEYEINDIDSSGAYFVEDSGHSNPYGYPLTSLENLTYKQQKEAA